MQDPKVIELIFDRLKNAPELAGIAAWQKATGLVTAQTPGCSVGADKDNFAVYTRDWDKVEAQARITFWVISADPVAGEAEVRQLARDCRFVLASDRTFGGAVDDSFVKSVEFVRVEGVESFTLMAQVDFRVTYYSPRVTADAVNPVEQLAHDLAWSDKN